jgi:hypothetical protein
VGSPIITRPKTFRRFLARALAGAILAAYIARAWLLPGEVTCDFAGPWLLGRMLAIGRGHDLYRVAPLRAALAEGYQGEQLNKLEHDLFLAKRGGATSGVEGPLYPPPMAVLMAPLGLFQPRAAHRTFMLVSVLGLLAVTRWLSGLTAGRLSDGEAACLLLLFPNVSDALVLGQNAVLTLTVVVGGWALYARGRPGAAGLVWGLLAYKPVFGVALAWVPLILGSGRFFLGMVISAAALCLVTVPACGLDAWLDWWQVGQNAAAQYAEDPNWIWMSRDLPGLPLRSMWDLEHMRVQVDYLLGRTARDPDTLQAIQPSEVNDWIGRGLLGFVLVTTAVVSGLAARRRRRAVSTAAESAPSYEAAFLLYGALLSCFHYMHYDLLPLALPTALLLAGPDVPPPRLRFVAMLLWVLVAWCAIDLIAGYGWLRLPFETFLLGGLWVVSGLATLHSFRFGCDENARPAAQSLS